ncbi:hypothetical protein EVAR_32350_1 [Eumeta japonica]|uniref:Uncharacterized protein n=1 Tax=Eumeta variegata TaxID=151549 RepID=A0A4C1ZCB7_EUMVA|nr:hypothetical protein EVAR_32350_1 [Eumeta japonica]
MECLPTKKDINGVVGPVDVETFRSLNKYRGLQSPISRITPLRRRKLKAVIRGISYRLPGRRNPNRPLRPEPCALGAQTLPLRRLTIMVWPLGYAGRGPRKESKGSATAASCCSPRGRQPSCVPALREMFGPTLDQRVPAYSHERTPSTRRLIRQEFVKAPPSLRAVLCVHKRYTATVVVWRPTRVIRGRYRALYGSRIGTPDSPPHPPEGH